MALYKYVSIDWLIDWFANNSHYLCHQPCQSAICQCAAICWFVGMLAKNAVERGLSIKPYIKTSLCPGTGVVCHYLQHGNVIQSLQQLRSALHIIAQLCCSLKIWFSFIVFTLHIICGPDSCVTLLHKSVLVGQIFCLFIDWLIDWSLDRLIVHSFVCLLEKLLVQHFFIDVYV